MADKTKDKEQAATSKQKDDKKYKKAASTKEEKQYKPRDPKGKKQIKKTKPTSDSKKDTEEDKNKTKPQNDAKSKRKHDKLVRKGKRISEKEKEKDTSKSKKKSKVICCKAIKDKGETNQGQEFQEENLHNKDLIDTVFHKMDVKVDHQEDNVQKEQEPVVELKYQKINDVEELIKEKEKYILELMHKVFQLYKPDEVLLSFNGGKDCTVVLHMLNKFFQSNSCLKHIKIPTLYITDPDAFEEIDEFVDSCEKLYNIQLLKKKGPIKEALKLVCQENDKLKAVFMGCRRTDPYCQDLKIMQMTDPGWPALMRINPILDWKCRQVWEYIYLYNVPYCILYQKGYTSIGNKNNTKPNPYLRLTNSNTGEVVDYRPGHELLDNDELERAGRF